MSLISRGFGALNKLITRGFYQKEFIEPVGYLVCECSSYPSLDAQATTSTALTISAETYQALQVQNVNS